MKYFAAILELMAVPPGVQNLSVLQYFGGHLGKESSVTWSPKFISFIFGTQFVFASNFKFLAEIVSEIWTMQYLGGHLGIEGSTTWGQKFINFVFWTQGAFAS